MISINHDLARTLMDERLAQAERVRTLRGLRRARAQRRQARPSITDGEADVIEVGFGQDRDSGQIGA